MTAFLAALNVVLLTRLWLFRTDIKATWTRVSLAGMTQILTLPALFGWGPQTCKSAAILIAATVILLITERMNTIRIVARLVILIATGIGLGWVCNTMQFSTTLPHARDYLQSHHPVGAVIASIHWRVFQARALGVLLCLEETNLLLRIILRTLKVTAPSDLTTHSPLIGLIERMLIFIFTVNNQFNAVGFILTAKSIVRFHEAQKTEAVSYILIGTLLSTLSAIVLARCTEYLILGQ